MTRTVCVLSRITGGGETELRPPVKDKRSDPDWVLLYEPRHMTIPISPTEGALVVVSCIWQQTFPEEPCPLS